MKVREIHDRLLEKAKDTYPELVTIFERQGPLFIPRRLSESLFLYLTRTVVNEHIPTKIADSIWSRLLEVAEGEKGTCEDTFLRQFDEEIRGKGLGREQMEALEQLRKVFLEGLVDDERLHQGDYEMVRRVVSRHWGYGTWSADMTAIFYFGLPDIWVEGDPSLKNGLRNMLDDRHRAQASEVPAAFSPFRSYLALHVWRFMEAEPRSMAG